MDYKILSRDMQDKEVEMLMSMLVPGSSVCRIERLHDINGIDVYFKKEASEHDLMISFFPDEPDECQFHIPTINEQILKFAQNYPISSKTSSSDAPFLMN